MPGRNDKCVQNFSRKTLREKTTRRRWEDNIKMNVAEISYEGVDWIHLPQDGVQWHGNELKAP